MNFLKKRGKILLIIALPIFLIVQQIAVGYGRSYRSQAEDKLVLQEVNQLRNVWHKAGVEDLVTPEKMANHPELELARLRLKEAEMERHNSGKRIEAAVGKKNELFQKVDAYYHDSALALIAIVDFLLAKKEEYTVNGNEINFESDIDAERFRELINQLSSLHQEKQLLDACILRYHKE